MRHQAGINDLPLREVQFAGKIYQTGKPVRIPYREERLWKPTRDDPAGDYIVYADEDETPDGFLRFRRPLVMSWGAPRGPKSWSWKLSRELKKRGEELTRRLQRARFDGIITIRWDRPYQIISLSGQEAEWFLDTPGVNRLMPEVFREFGARMKRIVGEAQDEAALFETREVRDMFEGFLADRGLLNDYQDLWNAWGRSTGSPPAQRLCGLLASLGVSGTPAEGDDMEHRLEGPERSSLASLVDHHYAFLQVYLRLARVREIRTYRGVYQTVPGRRVSLVAREASSWSLQLQKAALRGNPLSVKTPRERVLAIPATLPGLDTEVVVLGTQSLRTVRFESFSRQTGRARLWLSPQEEDWLR